MAHTLLELRDAINICDAEIRTLLEARLDIARGVAAHKKENNMPIFDESREMELLEKIGAWGIEKDYSKELTQDIWKSIMALSRSIQEEELEK